MNSLLTLLAACMALVAAYPDGPPVQNEGLCEAMVPTGHGVAAQTTDAPYEYVLSSPCYKAGMEIQVAIKANNADPDLKYFEGFFTQVQKKDVKGTSYGTFSTADTQYSQTLTCFGTANIAVGHRAHSHFDTRVFKWTAPADTTEPLLFRSTIVKGTTTFWVDVYSDEITYNDACVAETFTETNTIQAGYGGSSEEEGTTMAGDTSHAPSMLPGFLTALATLLFALLL